MPNVQVTSRLHFNAAHRLHNPDRSEQWNRQVFGKCNNPNGHGHNYILDVTVVGEPDPDTGYVIDLGVLKRIVDDRVIEHLDHKHLNHDVEFMRGQIPSTENLAIAIWSRLEGSLPSGKLYRVRLHETHWESLDYYGPKS